ncbi:serpin family protein [Herbivorax sp. ANBcel31]|uniref:serpin family protein n=1 Tax=Herbivorax sp. ANBcel31 TaxID=3069754 RepID=UPI0027B6A5FA|nr:serpin family protein [Herbivorax sp. ANBcel31]MDQ2085155.1 serpin family protein [Herbivorax sp. ANBcel31]
MFKKMIVCGLVFVMFNSTLLAPFAFGTERDLIIERDWITERDWLIENDEVAHIVYSPLYGDLTGDGIINSTDYAMLKRHILSVRQLSEEEKVLADLNGDGVIDSSDCVLLQRYILGTIDVFPVEENNNVINENISDGFIDGNSNFAFDIFNQLNLEDGDKNVFISPFNISVALSMVYQGADSETKDEIAEVLGFDNLEIEDVNASYKYLLDYFDQLDNKIKINNANSIWLNSLQGDVIKDDFQSVNEDVFDALVSSRNFNDQSVLNELNNWISSATEGMIENMLSSINPEVLTYIISAIYFNGTWTEEFDADNSYEKAFYMEDGSSKDIMMMYKRSEIEYGEGDEYKAVRLPYGNGEVSMYCILPDEGTSINDFIEDMDVNMWNQIKNSISKRESVKLLLPRFEIEYGAKSIVDSLTALGMTNAFDAGLADFSNIFEIASYISDIQHMAVIEVNEEGTEAAAATVVIITPTAAGPTIERPEFIADRPFMFVIADDVNDTILFMGKLCDID